VGAENASDEQSGQVQTVTVASQSGADALSKVKHTVASPPRTPQDATAALAMTRHCRQRRWETPKSNSSAAAPPRKVSRQSLGHAECPRTVPTSWQDLEVANASSDSIEDELKEDLSGLCEESSPSQPSNFQATRKRLLEDVRVYMKTSQRPSLDACAKWLGDRGYAHTRKGKREKWYSFDGVDLASLWNEAWAQHNLDPL